MGCGEVGVRGGGVVASKRRTIISVGCVVLWLFLDVLVFFFLVWSLLRIL